MQNSKNYGLQALTPMYGQVIVSAPSWSGPFTMPPVPPAFVPKTQAAITSDYYDKLLQNIKINAAIGLGLMFL
jgi:hypothetical protein